MVEVNMGVPLEKVKDFSLKELIGMAIKAEIGAREFYPPGRLLPKGWGWKNRKI